MEEQLITFETAQLAKEKGFDIPVIWGYQNENSGLYTKDFEKSHCYNRRGCYSAPTQSLLQKWLREKHDYHLGIIPFNNGRFDYMLYYDAAEIFEEPKDKYLTYESALEIGLRETLKLISNAEI